MRLFIAIETPQNVVRELIRIQRALKSKSEGGRFVPESNFHITLQFLGDVGDINGAVMALRHACRGIRPFPLHLGGYGYFSRGDAKTSFVNVLGNLSELRALYESLSSALADGGFPRANSRYTPHITLGRNVRHSDEAGEELKSISLNASMQVQGATLFESARTDGGMEYIPLHRERF